MAQAEDLVSQVQTAHRLAVGFYQRLLPLLTHVAGAFDMQFWYWEPTNTNRPSSSTTSPNSKWKWDLVPLFASRHVFWRIAGEQAQQGDVAIVFNVYLDEDFKTERRRALGIRGQPDPLALSGPAVVEIYLYRCTADNGEPFQKLWAEVKWPDEAVKGWHAVSPAMNAYRLEYSLAKFIAGQEDVMTDVRTIFAETTSGTD